MNIFAFKYNVNASDQPVESASIVVTKTAEHFIISAGDKIVMGQHPGEDVHMILAYDDTDILNGRLMVIANGEESATIDVTLAETDNSIGFVYTDPIVIKTSLTIEQMKDLTDGL